MRKILSQYKSITVYLVLITNNTYSIEDQSFKETKIERANMSVEAAFRQMGLSNGVQKGPSAPTWLTTHRSIR